MWSGQPKRQERQQRLMTSVSQRDNPDTNQRSPQRRRFPGPPHRWQRLLIEKTFLLLLLLLLVRATVQNFHIQGHSMEPTLHDQEYMLVNKTAYMLRPPDRGDVIVFHYPLHPEENYVKRIIGLPGDEVSIIGHTVIVNDVTLHETYVNNTDPDNPYSDIHNRIISPNDYFVLGDNRGNSSDSRQWGLVPRSDIIGKAIVVYWPFDVDNFGLLQDESSVFARVHS